MCCLNIHWSGPLCFSFPVSCKSFSLLQIWWLLFWFMYSVLQLLYWSLCAAFCFVPPLPVDAAGMLSLKNMASITSLSFLSLIMHFSTGLLILLDVYRCLYTKPSKGSVYKHAFRKYWFLGNLQYHVCLIPPNPRFQVIHTLFKNTHTYKTL